MTKQLLDFHHLDELKNFTANIFLKLVIKLCTGICALKMGDYHYRTSPIGHWGKGSTVGWYKVLRLLYL